MKQNLAPHEKQHLYPAADRDSRMKMKVAQASGVQPARDIDVSENVRSSRLNLSPSGLSTGKKATSGQSEK